MSRPSRKVSRTRSARNRQLDLRRARDRYRQVRCCDTDDIVQGRVIFSGSMLYPPSIQAVLWFMENVWPTGACRGARRDVCGSKGRNPRGAGGAAGRARRYLGNGHHIADVGVLIRSAQVCVNPMRAAGGMQNKLIGTWHGKAVVASSVANEGIRAPGNEEHWSSQNTDAFAGCGDSLAEGSQIGR